MNAADLERCRTKVVESWRPDMRCAHCWGPPTCPQLTDDVWGVAWRRAQLPLADPPRALKRCNCAEWTGSRWTRVTHKIAVGAEMHWHLCDLVAERRPLLCLECAELHLGRPIAVGDLKSCMSNYYAAKILLGERRPHLFRVVRVSNYNHEDHRGDQYFVAQRLTERDAARVAAALNDCAGPHSDNFYRVVPDDYQLPPDWRP